MPSYYPLWYQLDTQQQYLIWVTDLESDAKDVVLLDTNGCLLTFNHLSSLYEYTISKKLTISEEPLILFDLDRINHWIHNPLASAVDCVEMLHAWNLFSDLWQSVKQNRSPSSTPLKNQISQFTTSCSMAIISLALCQMANTTSLNGVRMKSLDSVMS